MFGKINQIFCTHIYDVYMKPEPIYLSVGDEVQDRKSYEYYMICRKCEKKITAYKSWHILDMEKELINCTSQQTSNKSRPAHTRL